MMSSALPEVQKRREGAARHQGGALGWTPKCDRIRGNVPQGEVIRCGRPARKPDPEVLRLNEKSGTQHLCAECFGELSQVLASWFASSQKLTQNVTYSDGSHKVRSAIQGPESAFTAAEVRAFFETSRGRALLKEHDVTLANRGVPNKAAITLFLTEMERRVASQAEVTNA